MQKRVVFFVPFGDWLVHNQLDAVVATALRLRGAEVVVVLCDGLMPKCYKLVRSGDPVGDCSRCAHTGFEFFNSFQLPTIQLREFLASDSLDRWRSVTGGLTTEQLLSFTHNGLELGRLLAPSVCSYFRVTKERLFDPVVLPFHREFLAYSLMAVEGLAGLFDQFNPTHLFVFCGWGFMHSGAHALARSRGISTVCHERGYYDGSFMLTSNGPCTDLTEWIELVKAWQQVPITAEEGLRIRDYFHNREIGKDTNFVSYVDAGGEHAGLRHKLSIPPSARIFSVFTSAEYELLYNWDDFKMVSTQMDVIDTLIEIFRGRDDFLVIRHHPNITGGPAGAGSDHRLTLRAAAQAASAPENVRVIMPDEKVSTYSLLWHTDAAISFLSTVRLEAVARGVATAAVNHPLIGAGVTAVIDDESRGGLERLVARLFERTERFDLNDLRTLYRTVNGYIFRHSNRFGSFEIVNGHEWRLNVNSAGELLPGSDATLDRVCDHVLSGSSLYAFPGAEEQRRSADTEERMLYEILSTIRENRAAVRRFSAEYFTEPASPVAVIVEAAAASTLSPSVFRFRSVPYRLQVSQPGELTATLGQSSEEFVLFANPGWIYDEALLSTLASRLRTEPTAIGARFGLWLLDSEGRIKQAAFCKNRKAVNIVELRAASSVFFTPFAVLGCCLFRREALLRLLSRGLVLEEIVMLPDLLSVDIPLAVAGPASAFNQCERLSGGSAAVARELR